MFRKYIRALLLIYGLLNAALYSSLLPLWEGFDEEFHYGYVQYLGAHHRFPVLGPTALSVEINRTIALLPMSYIMIRNVRLRGVRTFAQYFSLDSETRHALYQQAFEIPTDLRLTESAEFYTNYEVHHAPLPYLLMAVPDTLMSHVPIPRRVWVDRILAGMACVVIIAAAMWGLGAEIGLAEPYTAAALFLLFSCQMFWATVAHIGNDWLAVALAAWLVVWALRCDREPSMKNALWLAVIMGLGLLSKAYFLVFVPLYAIAGIYWRWKRNMSMRALVTLALLPVILSGPWYARNLMLYGNLTARVEESNGVTTASALKSLISIPWLKSIPFMARGAFWMGNSSFTDFSVLTMNLVLLLLIAGLILLIRYGLQRRDWFLLAPVLLFLAAMIYVTGSSYTFTKGEATAASPWYLQAVMAPLIAVAMLGYARAGKIGRWIAMACVLLWGYILGATYVAKLIPWYGGFSGGRSTMHDIALWYLHDWPRTWDILSTVALVPPQVLFTLLFFVLAAMVSAVVETLSLLRNRG